jgi:hypothetical protein
MRTRTVELVPPCSVCGKATPWSVNGVCAPCWTDAGPEERNAIRRKRGLLDQVEHWQEHSPGEALANAGEGGELDPRREPKP